MIVEVMYMLSSISLWLNLVNLYLRWSQNTFPLRRWWVKSHIRNEMRDMFGAYQTLFMYFTQTDHEEFYKMTRMTPAQFENLYMHIRHRLIKRSIRRPLSKRLRLLITLK